MDRLFLAIFPSSDIRSEISSYVEDLDRSLKSVRWSPAENLHYTLRFLGDCSPSDKATLARALDTVVAFAAPFLLEVRGVGVFPSWNRAKVFWLGTGAGGNVLKALSRLLDRELTAAGFGPRDKPFSPHLTLGRARDPRGIKLSPDSVQRLPESPVWQLPVKELCLVRSNLGQGPPRYEILRRAPLAGEVSTR